MTTKETLLAAGFDLYTFPTPAARLAFMKAHTVAAEFQEFEETHCHERFTTYILGVRCLRGKAAAHAAMEGK